MNGILLKTQTNFGESSEIVCLDFKAPRNILSEYRSQLMLTWIMGLLLTDERYLLYYRIQYYADWNSNLEAWIHAKGCHFSRTLQRLKLGVLSLQIILDIDKKQKRMSNRELYLSSWSLWSTCHLGLKSTSCYRSGGVRGGGCLWPWVCRESRASGRPSAGWGPRVSKCCLFWRQEVPSSTFCRMYGAVNKQKKTIK